MAVVFKTWIEESMSKETFQTLSFALKKSIKLAFLNMKLDVEYGVCGKTEDTRFMTLKHLLVKWKIKNMSAL